MIKRPGETDGVEIRRKEKYFTAAAIFERAQMLNNTFLTLIFCCSTFWPPSVVFASAVCDRLRNEPCEGESCLAKFKAIQDCETAVIAEDQARARRRQQQRQRDEVKRKKQLEETKIKRPKDSSPRPAEC